MASYGRGRLKGEMCKEKMMIDDGGPNRERKLYNGREGTIGSDITPVRSRDARPRFLAACES